MKVLEFKKYMQYGLGRCYAELSACNNKEKYRSAVLYGCLHSLAYDEQCEGTKAGYICELCSLFDDGEYFCNAVIAKFEKITARNNDFNHLCDLLCAFAKSGNVEAKDELENKYTSLYVTLLKPRKIKWYDFERDAFERLANCLVALDGLPAFLNCAKDMGNLFMQNDNYDGWDFECFYESFCRDYGKAETEEVLKEESKTSLAIKKFLECMQANAAEASTQRTAVRKTIPEPTAEEMMRLIDSGAATPADTYRFGKYASAEQKSIFADKIMRESDKDKQAEMLQAFRNGGFPLGVDGLAELFEHANQNLRFAVTDVLEETKDVQAHDMAVDFIEMDGNYLAGIRMLILNYTEADRELIINVLKNLNVNKADKDGLHSLFLKILNAYDDGFNLPAECLYFIYENSFCSGCRENAVEEMAKRGCLTEEIKTECLRDSNFDIRAFVQKLN